MTNKLQQLLQDLQTICYTFNKGLLNMVCKPLTYYEDNQKALLLIINWCLFSFIMSVSSALPILLWLAAQIVVIPVLYCIICSLVTLIKEHE